MSDNPIVRFQIQIKDTDEFCLHSCSFSDGYFKARYHSITHEKLNIGIIVFIPTYELPKNNILMFSSTETFLDLKRKGRVELAAF